MAGSIELEGNFVSKEMPEKAKDATLFNLLLIVCVNYKNEFMYIYQIVFKGKCGEAANTLSIMQKDN